MNLLGILKYGIFFSVLLVFLPLTARDGVLLHGLLGGLFVDLTAWAIFFVALGLLRTAWTLMFTEGLIVVGVERWHDGGAAYRPLRRSRVAPRIRAGLGGEVLLRADHRGAVRLLYPAGGARALDHRAVQRRRLAQGSGRRRRGARGGGLPAHHAVGARRADRCHSPADDRPTVRRAVLGMPAEGAAGREGGTAVPQLGFDRLPVLGDDGILQEAEGGRRRLIYPSHFIAVTNVIGLVVVAAVVAVVFEPARPATTLATGPADSESSRSLPSPPVTGQTEATSPAPPTGSLTWFGVSFPSELPAVLYLLVIVIGLVLAFTTVQSILGPYRVSPVLALLVIMLLGYRWSGTDHYFPVGAQTPRGRATLTPVEVAKAGAPDAGISS